MGFPESSLTCELIRLLGNFVAEHDLGLLAGEAGGTRLMPGVVRLPDISFVSWDRLPAREIPLDAILGMAPDLAVEVLSPSNTKREIDLKIRHFFLGGTRLVWVVDPVKRTVRVYTAPDQSRTLRETESLDGGDVLPGLSLPLRQVFARLPRRTGRRAKRPPRA
jgi:Uma2 family endonuclease